MVVMNCDCDCKMCHFEENLIEIFKLYYLSLNLREFILWTLGYDLATDAYEHTPTQTHTHMHMCGILAMLKNQQLNNNWSADILKSKLSMSRFPM